jgi:hypothetical protein
VSCSRRGKSAASLAGFEFHCRSGIYKNAYDTGDIGRAYLGGDHIDDRSL